MKKIICLLFSAISVVDAFTSAEVVELVDTHV